MVEFPPEKFMYLKMACAIKGVFLKDVTEAITSSTHDYENELDLKALEEALTEENLKNAISLDKLKSELL